jgi:glyoxylase-like metal-dependent hydrolase (beta-lactamase superfamily II)
VWLARGGFPGQNMNVYLVRDTHPASGQPGVLAFDTGVKQMAPAIAKAAAALGGLTRVVLGHAHGDHRGSAKLLGVPVLCHADERADAEGNAGTDYYQLQTIPAHGRLATALLLRYWDAGPVKIAATPTDGDQVAGFEVIHLPGHAPGLIALWRATDRLALTSDCFYTFDPLTTRHGPARVPHHAFNHDTELARASIRKLADLEPASAWPGHAQPLTGDVAAQLKHAAATT